MNFAIVFIDPTAEPPEEPEPEPEDEEEEVIEVPEEPVIGWDGWK